MAISHRLGLATTALLATSLCSGCTLAKPLVGAVVGPAVMLGNSGGDFGCGCGDGRAFLAVLAAGSAVGAVAGLVTGIVSDVQALTGDVADPCANWWDPFKTNASSGGR